ncbi:MAG TPA: LPS export ABC transporter permease LptF [Sedimenticola sp.]|nr:LPS export ABC transporter permease LptF [Sedimenticola sp.]
MIIDRYIATEIAKPFAIAISGLVVIFIAYTSAVILNDVVAGKFGVQVVATLIMLRTLIIMEVLLPTALYLSVVMGIGRLYRDSEMVALWSLGVSEKRLLRSVLPLALVVALLVASISLYGRPWAYRLSYQLEQQAALTASVEQMRPGHFSVLGDGRLVFTADRVDVAEKRAEKVFVQHDTGTGRRVIRAAEARLLAVKPDPKVRFTDGYAYDFDMKGGNDSVMRFGSMTLDLYEENEQRVEEKRKAKPTAQLDRSRPKELAEYQWRLSMPLATLMLGVLALPLSYTRPRQGRHLSLFIAIVVYALFFNLTAMARTWVEHGNVGAVPGIWWVHLLLAILLLALLARRRP